MNENRVVLVSAGAAGIGRRIAESFLAHGDRVYVFDVSRRAIDILVRERPEIRSHVADASDTADVDGVLAEREGRLDVLVNNVGISGPTAPVEEISIARAAPSRSSKPRAAAPSSTLLPVRHCSVFPGGLHTP